MRSASFRWLAVGASLVLLSATRSAVIDADVSPTLRRIYELGPTEGVFAYARIAPSGHLLAYASQLPSPSTLNPNRIVESVRVVDLRNQKTVFQELGVDAYWSPDGRRLIYLSTARVPRSVSIVTLATGDVLRDVAPIDLGDYYSWGRQRTRDVILTIRGNFFTLSPGGGGAHLPAQAMPECPTLGPTVRPLLSKDATLVSAFAGGSLIVRNLLNCDIVIDTHTTGAKADFSFDRRYLAFHAPKSAGEGYEIRVIDLARRTTRTVTALPGSSLFPSWTRDGRLCFRYDGPEYRGFIMLSNFARASEDALPAQSYEASALLSWRDVFSDRAPTGARFNVVVIWAPWSAHAREALVDAASASKRLLAEGRDIRLSMALEPSSDRAAATRILAGANVDMPEVHLLRSSVALTGAANQIPVTLMFRDDGMVGRHLGPQTTPELLSWIHRLMK